MSVEEEEDPIDADEEIPVALTIMQWGEVCAALGEYVNGLDPLRHGNSMMDAKFAQQTICRVMKEHCGG